MRPLKIVSIVGARPQFVKAAVVSKAVRAFGLNEILVHTGQHYDANMSRVFFEELEIPEPDYNLEIGSSLHGDQTGRMLQSIEAVLLKEKPHIVQVYGDTNSTLAGSLAASKLHIPVAHVEAGLRSFNRRMPEEINRIVADHISDLLFTPTKTADENLLREGVSKGVHRVGDVMYDAVLHYRQLAVKKSGILTRIGMQPKGFALVTIHRAENTDDSNRLRNILAALQSLAAEMPVVFPVHPRTRKILESSTGLLPGNAASGKLFLIEPVSYLDMLVLESESRVILTDSGGVQKEAFFFGTPCVTLRPETEWVETVEAGWNTLSDDNAALILESARSARTGDPAHRAFGDGDATSKIATILRQSV